MQTETLVLVLTFAVILLLIMMAKTIEDAILVISLVANFLFISISACTILKLDKNINISKTETDTLPAFDTDIYQCKNKSIDAQQLSDTKDNITVSTKPVLETSNNPYSVNDRITELSGQDRNKKTLKGILNKTAKSYAGYYGDEFNESEKKIWWE